jgi:hypothetical protein
MPVRHTVLYLDKYKRFQAVGDETATNAESCTVVSGENPTQGMEILYGGALGRV